MAVQLKKLTNRLYNPLKIRDTLDMYLYSYSPSFFCLETLGLFFLSETALFYIEFNDIFKPSLKTTLSDNLGYIFLFHNSSISSHGILNEPVSGPHPLFKNNKHGWGAGSLNHTAPDQQHSIWKEHGFLSQKLLNFKTNSTPYQPFYPPARNRYPLWLSDCFSVK